MKKTRKPEVKLVVDRAVDRSFGVAGLMEISARIFVEPGRVVDASGNKPISQ